MNCFIPFKACGSRNFQKLSLSRTRVSPSFLHHGFCRWLFCYVTKLPQWVLTMVATYVAFQSICGGIRSEVGARHCFAIATPQGSRAATLLQNTETMERQAILLQQNYISLV